MKIIKVIESRCWTNKETGQTASIYGSVPWTTDQDKEHWTITSRGYTWLTDQGTVGLGRQPVKTEAEAVEIMNKINALRGSVPKQ